MSDIQTLLTDNISDEEKYKAANNIIVNYELPLSADQILLAFNNILDWINTCLQRVKNIFKTNRMHLLNKALIINKNMFVAIILALCNNFDPYDLNRFMVIDDDDFYNIGLNYYHESHLSLINSCYKLLDQCEIDFSNIPNIRESDKRDIEAYRAEKYPCKLTKCAIKK